VEGPLGPTFSETAQHTRSRMEPRTGNPGNVGHPSNSYYFLLEGQTPPGRQMQFSLLTPKPGDCERKRFGGFRRFWSAQAIKRTGWQRLHGLK
jgi:hypothetical protein